MTFTLATPDEPGLRTAIEALASWQRSGEPLQLHPGDVGWHGRLGAATTADAVRTWSADGRPVAVALLDGGVPRITTDPALRQDRALAEAMAADLVRPERGVLPQPAAGEASLDAEPPVAEPPVAEPPVAEPPVAEPPVADPRSVEVPAGSMLEAVLAEQGWAAGEPWTPLERDLADPVVLPPAPHPLRIVEVRGDDAALVEAWAAVQRSAFGTTRATTARWHAMAAGPWASHACTLLGFDGDAPAAGIVAWSAGEGRPGLIEPLGVHVEHRGRGFARAITLAAAAALRARGATSAQVCTEAGRAAAVATYRSAGFEPQPTRYDRVRAA
jgi:ribosomal protein S18 acetylase RimI-like enzyme